MTAYVELLMAEYSMSYREAFHDFPVRAGLCLMEARRERLAPGSAASHVDRLAMQAMDAEKARIAREFTLID